LQSDVGNGAIAEHPMTQVAPAGKACAVSAAAMFATMPDATPATTAAHKY
jgi:hypothetical protein